LAATKRTPAKRGRTGGSGAATTGGERAERPRIQSSHGARSYAAKKAHGARKAGATTVRAAGPRSAVPKSAGKSATGAAVKSAGTAVKSAGPRTKKVRTAGATPASSLASDEARETAMLIAIAAIDKKALGIEILDVAGKVDYADFLVLMTGRSDRQVGALADGIEEALRKKNRRAVSIEGRQASSWILMDFGDVVVHVFQDDARSLYDIEGLWLDARRLPVPLPEGMKPETLKS